MKKIMLFFLVFPLHLFSQQIQREEISVVGKFWAKDSLNGVFIKISDGDSTICKGFTGPDVPFKVFLPRKKIPTYIPARELMACNNKVVYFKGRGFYVHLPDYFYGDDFFIETGTIQIF